MQSSYKDQITFHNHNDSNSRNSSEAIALLQAAAEYSARPSHLLDSAQRSDRLQPMADSYRPAVEEYRQCSESITAREDDFKNGRSPRGTIQANKT